MVKHIVLWTFKKNVDAEKTYQDLRTLFASFVSKVPDMVSFNIYRGFRGYDICLESVHKNKAALEAYQSFPDHVAAKEIVKSNRELRASCDFEMNADMLFDISSEQTVK